MRTLSRLSKIRSPYSTWRIASRGVRSCWSAAATARAHARCVRRRAVIDAVAQTGETTLGDLADRIAADQHDITTEQVSSDQRKCVYVALYQIHLNTLDDHEVVDWDKDRETIAPGPTFECAEAVLEAARGEVDGGERA